VIEYVLEEPEQIVAGPEIVPGTGGGSLTVMVVVAVALQPLPSVPVTV
jgi:hypothetical protein